MLARAGSFGRHPGNVDRDTRRWQRRERIADDIRLEPYVMKIPMKRLRGVGTEDVNHSMILPHELLHTLHKVGGKAWRDGILGPSGDDSGIADFWAHECGKPWYDAHPATQDRERLPKTVRISFRSRATVL